MKCYIATKFDNQNEFHAMRGLLEDAGHQITTDWTKHTVPVGDETQDQFLNRCAHEDFDGVFEADALIFIVTPDMAGAYTELGIALAMAYYSDYAIIIVGYNAEKHRNNIFFNHSDVIHVASKEDAVKALELHYDNIRRLEAGVSRR